MMKFRVFHVLLFFSCISLNAQLIPCVDGFAGEFPCQCYDLVSTISNEIMEVDIKTNDSWGWTDELTGIEYAIVCSTNKTAFIELSDPIHPIYLGYINTQTSSSTWRDCKVYNDHAFIVSEAPNHGMQIFDLTRLRNVDNPPVQFTLDAYYDGFGGTHNIAINESSGYAYPIGGDLFAGGPQFINIQDPTNPVLEGGFEADGYSHDAQIIIYQGPDVEHQGKEIFFGYNATAVTIVDVTDKTDPTILSQTSYENYDYVHQGWIDEQHEMVFIDDELDTGFTRTIIMDCTDLDNPQIVEDYYAEFSATDHNQYVKGDKLYQANNAAGMRVLQISDEPGNRLEEIGYFDVYPENDDWGFTGSWNVYPFFESGNILISSREYGMMLVRPSSVESCAVGIKKLERENFSIYPNPASNEVYLKHAKLHGWITVDVFDVLGQLVQSNTLKATNGIGVQLDVSNLVDGLYNIVVNGEFVNRVTIIR